MPTEKERRDNPSHFCTQLRGIHEQIAQSISRLHAALEKHPVSPLLYLTVGAVAVGYFTLSSMIPSHAAVSADPAISPEVVAVQEAYIDALPSGKPVVESDAAVILEDVPAPIPEASGLQVFAMQDEPEAYAAAAEPVADQVYALKVEDEVVGYSETEEALYKLLDDVAQPWISPNTIRYDFVEKVEVVEAELPEGAQCDLDAITAKLSSLRTEKAVYTVQAGDTFNGIALNKLNMNPDELAALNPDVDVNVLYVGDELTYQQPVPFLSVLCLTNETYQAVDKSPVEYIGTPNLYVGTTQLKTQGEDGLSLVSAQVTYCNGIEQERTIVATEVLKEATTTEMYSGTTPRPKTASNGYYIWPVSGRITSRFGWRNLWGYRDFHTGLDIACPYGTNIKAADGGTVIYAGWQGSYGKLVGIRHDNGSETYYAHCSAILVSVGQKVYQGQTIARVGLTGNTSGAHCHFEVRINGTRVNPLNYLG